MKKKKFSKNRFENQINTEKKPFFTNKNIGLMIVGGIVFIMVFSIFAISLSNDTGSTDKIKYHGFDLYKKDSLWVVKINGVNYGFEYSPQEVENIKGIVFTNDLFDQKTYVTLNSSEFTQDSLEVNRIKQFLQSLGIIAPFSCISEENCGDLPVISCNQSKQVYLKNGQNNQIYKDNNCVVLEAIPGDEALVINRFMYGALGVI